MICLDASVAVKVAFREEHSHLATALVTDASTRGEPLAVPALFAYEITNAVLQRIRRATLDLELALPALDTILMLPFRVFDLSSLHGQALGLASRLGLRAAYDAHYLLIAQRERCPFWTADERLLEPARREGIDARWIGGYSTT